MRWVSLCTALGAVLLPAVNAIPVRRPCNPHSATTTSAALVAETATSSISTLTSTPTETATTTLGLTETTTLITYIRTDTTVPTITTDSTATTDVSTTSTATPTVDPLNGNFEGLDRSGWQGRTVNLVDDPANAFSGSWYAEYLVTNNEAQGGNNLNQTINGLDTSRLFRLSFEGKLFEGAILGGANCNMEALFSGQVLASWPIDPAEAGHYVLYTKDFSVPYKNTQMNLRLRCDAGKPVTIRFAVDDISFKPLEQSAATQTTILEPAASTSALAEP